MMHGHTYVKLKSYYGQTLEVNEDVAGPISRWTDGVEEDAMKLGCRNWQAAAEGRGRWRHLL